MPPFTIQTRMNSAVNDSMVAEIEALMKKRGESRNKKEWALADEIRRHLEAEPYNVEISDFCDKPSSWTRVIPNSYTIEWSRIETAGFDKRKEHQTSTGSIKIPIVVATVDAPHYRERLKQTVRHLGKQCSAGCGCTELGASWNCRFCPQPYYLLDLCMHPSVGTRRILIEGWRSVLLPKLLAQTEECVIGCQGCDFVLVAEDDIRLGDNVTARRILDECSAILEANPGLNLLSLGHAWAAIRDKDSSTEKRRGSLLEHVLGGGGVHGTTLIAMRYPQGVQQLLDTLNANKSKQTHFDQFLFFSELHDLSLALCDRPLVGWAEVESTLTKSASGHRRQGGGRLAFTPVSTTAGTRWVRRVRTEKAVSTIVHQK